MIELDDRQARATLTFTLVGRAMANAKDALGYFHPTSVVEIKAAIHEAVEVAVEAGAYPRGGVHEAGFIAQVDVLAEAFVKLDAACVAYAEAVDIATKS